MKPKSFAGMRCSIAGALELIGDKWAILLVRDLAMGICRYDDLRANSGIPTTTLANRLKRLESDGVLSRVRYQERPPRDEYRLTEKGQDLWKITAALREWGDRWDASGYGAPEFELVDRLSGQKVYLALVDPETGQAIPPERLEYRPGPGADEKSLALLRRFYEGTKT